MALLVGGLALGACGIEQAGRSPTTTGPVGETTTSSPVVTSTGELEVIVPPDEGGEYPDDLLVSCDQGVFPLSALDDIRSLAEADPGGVAEAIAPFLANEEGQNWPQEGWQLLYETEERVHLVARSEHGGLAHMYVTNDGSGWTWSGSSLAGDECRLQFVVPEGLNTVEWRLDPDAPEPTTTTMQLSVLLTELQCVGGIEIGDRLVGPQVVMTDTRVFVAFAAEPPPGDAFTCQGNPSTEFVVDLPERLGDRELMEGLEIGITLEDYLD